MMVWLIPKGTPTKSRMSPTLVGMQQDSCSSSASLGDQQYIVITSEKQGRVVALPSQNCLYKQQISETDYVIKAEIINLKGE